MKYRIRGVAKRGLRVILKAGMRDEIACNCEESSVSMRAIRGIGMDRTDREE